MGLFSYFGGSNAASTEADSRATAVRTGAVAPSRQERALCYVARDGYFGCLDANNIVDPLGPDAAKARRACGAEERVFERDCAAQWVTYFKKWRVADLQKKQRMAQLEAEGANKMDVKTDFLPRSTAEKR